MQAEALDQGLMHNLTLPTLPVVVSRLNRALAGDDASADEIARIIRDDPSLTAQVLKVVNSPAFGLRTRIDSIQRGVVVMGNKELRNIAVAVSAIKVFPGVPSELFNMAQFWRHSIYVGLIARLLAIRTGSRDPERHFTAGLLHDIGELAIASQLPDQELRAMEMSRQEERALFDTEHQVHGFDHADIGGVLLREWGLPEHLCQAVENHHALETDSPFEYDISIVHLANLVADNEDLGRWDKGYVIPLEAEAWERLGLNEDMLDDLVAEARGLYEETHRALLS